MTQVDVSKSLPGTNRLWRYMSLDKLIDLLATSELFFTPLAWFQETDPFEGFLPAVALDADASISRKFIEDAERTQLLVAEHRGKGRSAFDGIGTADVARRSGHSANVKQTNDAGDCEGSGGELLARQ